MFNFVSRFNVRRDYGGVRTLTLYSALALAAVVLASYWPIAPVRGAGKHDAGPSRDLRASFTEDAEIDESVDGETPYAMTASGEGGSVAGLATGRRYILVSSFKCPSAVPFCEFEDSVLKYDGSAL